MLHLVGTIKRMEVLSCDAAMINKPSSKSLGPFVEKVIRSVLKNPDKKCQVFFTGGKKSIDLAVKRLQDCLSDITDQRNELVKYLVESFEIADGQIPRQKDTHCFVVSYYCETEIQRKKRLEEEVSPN